MQLVAGIAVLAPLLALLERLNPEVDRTKIRKELRTDFAYFAAQVVWLPICGLFLAILIDASSRGRPPIGSVFHVYGVQAAAAFGLMELTAYWTHRIEHTLPILWRVHALHHAPRDVYWVTSFRFHPADVAIQQLVPSLVVVAVGFPIVSLAPYLIVAGVVTLFAHCNLCLPSNPLIVTPGYHRTHHETERVSNNFALTLPVMDTLFGTASFEQGGRNFGTTSRVPDRGYWRQLRWGLGLTKQEETQ